MDQRFGAHDVKVYVCLCGFHIVLPRRKSFKLLILDVFEAGFEITRRPPDDDVEADGDDTEPADAVPGVASAAEGPDMPAAALPDSGMVSGSVETPAPESGGMVVPEGGEGGHVASDSTEMPVPEGAHSGSMEIPVLFPAPDVTAESARSGSLEIPVLFPAPDVTAAPDDVESSVVPPAETEPGAMDPGFCRLAASESIESQEEGDTRIPPPESTKISGAHALKGPREELLSVARPLKPLTPLEQKLAASRAKLKTHMVNLNCTHVDPNFIV